MTKRAFITVLSLVFLLLTWCFMSGRAYATSVSDAALILVTSQAVTSGAKSLQIRQSEVKSLLKGSGGAKSTAGGSGVNPDSASKKQTYVKKICEKALSLVGSPYRWGGESIKGFDCSGLTRYIYRHSAGIDLPRTSLRQAKAGKYVERKALKPGDIVYFRASGPGVGHVGIFVGSGKFVHATPSKGVRVSSLSEKYWVKHYLGARRIISG